MRIRLGAVLLLTVVAVVGCNWESEKKSRARWSHTDSSGSLTIEYKLDKELVKVAEICKQTGELSLTLPGSYHQTVVNIMPEASIRLAKWSLLNSPPNLISFDADDNSIVAIGAEPGSIWRLRDGKWHRIRIGLNTGELRTVQVDQGKIYLACSNGLAVSDQNGENFHWLHSWRWDGYECLDIHNGRGWGTIPSWGSLSGPIQITPEGCWAREVGFGYGLSDENWAHLEQVIADPDDPNRAFLVTDEVCLITVDRGLNWKEYPHFVVGIFPHKGGSVIFARDGYSLDRGQTWLNHGLSRLDYVSQDSKADVFLALTDSAILVGEPEAWLEFSAIPCESPRELVSANGKLCLRDDDKIYTSSLDGRRFSGKRHGVIDQGSLSVGFDQSKLTVSFTGRLSTLTVGEKLTLFPPKRGKIGAYLEANTIGSLDIDPNGGFIPIVIGPSGEAKFIADRSDFASRFGYRDSEGTIEVTLDQRLPVTERNDPLLGAEAGPVSTAPLGHWLYEISIQQ